MSDDDLIRDGDEFREQEVVHAYSVDIDRILAAFGLTSLKHIISFQLGCEGPSPDLVLTVKKYVTHGDIRRLTEALEANPPQLKEQP